jgi:hypothetical protein
MSTTSFRERVPPHLLERTRTLSDHSPPESGEFIVYWMHHAVRGHENPALDLARLAAETLDRPLLVYQGLGGAHRFDSDRHHTFIMEGARDAARELRELGVRHVFHLSGDPSAPTPLRDLLRRAALVVTEDLPAPPFPRWTRRFAARASAPMLAVDTSCLIPMRAHGRAFSRAFEFRKRNQDEYERRLGRAWPTIDVADRPFEGELGFEPTDLESADIGALCAACAIDHGVGPVRHTPGGSVAAYARWRAFRDERLAAYARRRNDATDPDAVSRMSAYLHHGHVSPFRLAREAHAHDSDGAGKFLDELLIWRELAHAFCFYTDDLESFAALPGWARATLREHEADPREPMSWERLARAKTGDPLWDTAQRSLLAHGELHNNVRMTWGKALLQWTTGPEEALRILIDLNHRYALDGNDPNSYGGLLWCLGAFDRPFEPAKPVLGTVRPRPTGSHAKRLDLARYRARIDRPSTQRRLEVAVIGAGLSGLAAARTLADHGHGVRVFEETDAVGGRASALSLGGSRVDHGAQYFTARDERFARYVRSWQHEGLVRPWRPRLVAIEDDGRPVPKLESTTRYVGVPTMRALAEHLAHDVDVTRSTRVDLLERSDGRWQLRDGVGQGVAEADVVLVAAPPATAAALLRPAPEIASLAEPVEMNPTVALVLRFAEPVGGAFDAAFVNAGPLRWVARHASKPGRDAEETWVAHAGAEFSRASFEAPSDGVRGPLLEAFSNLFPSPLPPVAEESVYRWAAAIPSTTHDPGCLWSAKTALGACGDWCMPRARIEGAFLSGVALAGRVLGSV